MIWIKWIGLAVLIAFLVVTYLFLKQWASNSKNKQEVDSLLKLDYLAETAVSQAEKLGLEKNFSGQAQFNYAVNYMKQYMTQLGLTPADEELIQGIIQKTYYAMKQVLVDNK